MATLSQLAPTLDTVSIPAALRRPGDPVKPPAQEVANGEPAEEIQKEMETKATKVTQVPTKEQEEEQKEEQKTELQIDPWEPIKLKFKDREPAEVLNEYETLQRERDEARTKAEEREIAAKELQEKLVSYDARHDPDFIKNALQPVEEAKATLVEVCMEDMKLAEEAYALQRNKELEPKERVAKLKALLEENGVTHTDWIRAYKALEKAAADSGSYQANYKEIKAQKDKERLVAQEMHAKQQQDTLRQVHRTVSFKVENELKGLGVDFLTGMDDVRRDHMLNLEKALSGGGYDQEQEVKNNLVGRLFLKNAKDLQAKLKELDELKAAARSKPADSPKADKKALGGAGDTKGLESKIFGR